MWNSMTIKTYLTFELSILQLVSQSSTGQTSKVNNIVYFPAAGKGSWSGYGPRPRGRGIVDQCCRPGGCGLHVLERYCAKPKGPKEQQTMTTPTVTLATQTVTVRLQWPNVSNSFSSSSTFSFNVFTSSFNLLLPSYLRLVDSADPAEDHPAPGP